MIIAGIDEAGRGPLAGPVVCAAVILHDDCSISGLNDSKKLSETKRNFLFDEISRHARAYHIVFIAANEIDVRNIFQATMHGMTLALVGLPIIPDLALVDGNALPKNMPCNAQAIIKGDTSERCIMAASILAKVSRDRYMQALDKQYPQYGFAKHKGYPTAMHLQALSQHGICPEHRRSYAPVIHTLTQQRIGTKS